MDENLPSIMPELKAPISFEQFKTGIDPAMELIRSTPPQ
jgi:hypothetical protein